FEPLAIGKRRGEQLVVAVKQVSDGAFADGHAARQQGTAYLGDGAVEGVAEPADQGDDVEAELVVGQDDAPLGLRAIGPVEGKAGLVAAASDSQYQPDDALQGGDGAAGGVVGPHEVAAVGALTTLWAQLMCRHRGGRLRLLRHGPSSSR